MYKNLHLSYIQMANDVFGDEDNNNASVIKEFERFGNDVGAWSNENFNKQEETKYSSILQRRFIYEKEDGKKLDFIKKAYLGKNNNNENINNDNLSTSSKKSYGRYQKRDNEKTEINRKNSEEVIKDFSKQNSKTSSYKINRKKDDLIKSPYNSSYNSKNGFENVDNSINEGDNYKTGSYKKRRNHGSK